MSRNLQILHIERANLWRMQYNPLRGLTIARAVSALEQGEQGNYAELQWLYRFIEKRDSTLRALVRRRSSALSKLDWNIKTVPEDQLPKGTTEKQAEAQRDYLRGVYDRIDNLTTAIKFLAIAEFRGFAMLEKHFDRASGDILHLEPVPQWHWCRDGFYGAWQYNADAKSSNKGVDIAPENFVIREVEDPINEIGLITFLRKNLGQKDWDGFIESFGIPPIFLVMPQNITKEDATKFEEIASEIMSNARGALPGGSDVKTVAAGERGTNPFREHLDYQDEQLVMAGTGGKLTMLNQATGIGGSQSETHDDAFDDLAAEEAKIISEILQKQIDQIALAKAFEGQPVLAYFELAAEEETDINDLCTQVGQLSTAGYRMDPEELSEKTGYTLTAAQAIPGQIPGQPIDPAEHQAAQKAAADQQLQIESVSNEIEAYGVAVRAGAITPNVEDEAFFREKLSLPSLPAAVRKAWREDQTRTPITISKDVPPAPPAIVKNRAAFGDEVAAAFAADLAPIRERLRSIREISDPAALQNALEQFQRDLPGLLESINADPASAAALAVMMEREFALGFDQAARQTKTGGAA